LVIDHIGIVVKSIEEGIEHWKNVFGYEQFTEIIENTRQRVRVAFLKKDNSITIKLVEPVNSESPVHRFALKGGGLHHLCFKCENLDEAIIDLQNKGLRILTPPEEGEAFENEKIAFVYGKSGLNIELIDTEKKANKLRAK
jgi:methylmalonyl-CoA/ethylmalonyl-CoA epimerase